MSRPLRQSTQHLQPADNLDRWMVSYADFVTLLFAFFVVMYAISSVNDSKYKAFGVSVFEAFGGQGQAKLNTIVPLSDKDMLLKMLADRKNAKIAERLRIQQEAMQRVANNLKQVMSNLVSKGQVKISQTNRGVVLEINASALFDQGEAELQSNALKTLVEVASILGPGDQSIEIEGYTDNIPIKTPRFPSNWELSSARASSVARLFIAHGVGEARLTVVGSAANHPVASNDTAEGRALNRRMIVTLMSPSMERTAQ